LVPTLLLAALASAPAPQQGHLDLEAAYHGRTSWERLDLEGYAGASSVRAGEELAFHVSSPYPYRVEFFRIGESEKLLLIAEDLPAHVQRLGANAYQAGCKWEASFYLPVPQTWRSGLHIARLKSSRADSHDIPFIVRPPARGPKRRILSISPDLTVQAYNSYGGRNIHATQFGRMSPLLSFDRPLDPLSPGTLDEQWDLNFHAWLEEELPEIDYASDVDLHLEADLLDGYDLVILSGHHEYWTAPMRAAIDAHVGNGGNLFVAASNVACWQIRIQDGGRRFRCHKKPWQDPTFNDPKTRRRTTSRFATAPVFDPPESTFGIAFRHANCAGSGPGEVCPPLPIEGTPANYGYIEGFGHYRLALPGHPYFERAAEDAGSLFGVRAFGTRVDERMVSTGGELDGANLEAVDGHRVASRASGSPSNLLVLGDAPTVHGFATLARFQDRGTVFHTGSRGLLVACADPNLADPEVGAFLTRALHDLMPGPPNLVTNGGFERWNGNAPLGFHSDRKARPTRHAMGGKRALLLGEKNALVRQSVSLPEKTRRLHLSYYADAALPAGEVVLVAGQDELLSVPFERGTRGFHYGATDVPRGTETLHVVVRKPTAGSVILDDLQLLDERAFRARAWKLAAEHSTDGSTRIEAGRHTGGQRYLVHFEARTLPSGSSGSASDTGATGELRLVSQSGERESLLGRTTFSGDWQAHTFEARDPFRGTRPAFAFELLSSRGAEAELRGLRVLPLRVASPPPTKLLLTESTSISSTAGADDSSTTVRRLAAIAPGPYLLTGWVRGKARLSLGTESESFIDRAIDSEELIALQEEFHTPALESGQGRITLVVPAGREASLRDVRLRPKGEVVENDLVSNGAFELRPSPQEIATGLDWSDRPPGWVTLEGTRLRLDTGVSYRGGGSLRIDSSSVTGGAQHLLSDHLPITSPLRLHAHVRGPRTSPTRATIRLMASVFQPERAEVEVASLSLEADGSWRPIALSAPPDARFEADYPVRGWVRIEVEEGTLWIDDLVVEADSPGLFLSGDEPR